MVDSWPELAEALLALAAEGLNFSEWEELFLESLCYRDRPSPKQQAILERMAYSCELDTPAEAWEELRVRLERLPKLPKRKRKPPTIKKIPF